ncbi:MAG: ATP-grasp fold amidoligase family protein, partial [Senegalia sp. (in: firmicutes)]|uniref:ATP-grasp fold amidoligase family protein n=1 Tax=Senegalia sp. (in: firmicutes) TaxID=1924098 RepID=UPI003F9DA7A8
YYLIGAVIIAIIVFFVSQYIPALYEITGARLEQFINLILGRSVEDASINTRLSLIDMTIKLIVKRPILGYGLDSFRIIGPWGIVADNNFLEILVSSGIIGFVIYYSYLFFIIHDYFSIKKKSKICKILFFIFILTLGMEIGSVTYFERNFMFTNIITYYILYKEMKENDMINKNSNIRNKIFEKLSSIWHVDYIQQFVPSRLYLKIQYKNFMGKKLNFKNPKTFNEKLQWLKVYDKNPEYTNLVDKYEVRKHIENIIGEEYLIPLIGVYDSFDDIPFQKLPKKFVLKSTHTSGNVFICKNKANINYSELEFKINEWLERKYYWVHREWPYKNIKPRIICEEYIVDESGIDLKDYKFMCFNGQPKIIQVMSERSNGNYRINHFDLEWNRLELPRKKYYENDKKISKPKDLKKMIEISKKLSQSIPFSRIDLYQTTKGVFFGEVTFFPVSGYMDFQNEKDDYLLGSWIDLPN